MKEKKQTYLENQLEAKIEMTPERITITFQKEKIKFQDELEVALLKSANPFIRKEITFTEDELILTFHPEKYQMSFNQVIKREEKSRWMFAMHLVKAVADHSSKRLHLFVCPENIVIDESMTPTFLHYGVKESVPPYEKNDEQTLRETKALIAAAIEPKYSFEQYYQFSDSIERTGIVEKILQAKNEGELITIIQKQMKKLVEEEKNFTKMTVVKRNWLRYSIIALLLLVIPSVIYNGYSVFVLQPQQDAYVYAQEHFLQKKYSEVINTLSNYEIDNMPKVIQYELSIAHIINETLTEDQKDNVLNTITLQTDPRYYEYWIFLGRGQVEKALTLSRQLEDLDLIMLALLHYEEEVKLDSDLKEDERERILNEIDIEKKEYEKQIEELQKLNENEKTEATEKESAPVNNEQQETNASSQAPAQTQSKQESEESGNRQKEESPTP
mgnify:CR=1 FL=1